MQCGGGRSKADRVHHEGDYIMSYARSDFSESMDRATITPDKIDKVLAAWGESTEGYGEWSGGFLLKLKDGRFAYLTGWCDTTGWGCQDGASIDYFDKKPKLSKCNNEEAQWDDAPADLNKWLADGADHDKIY